ncbi:unnamed protein product [Chrysoparadoxa australica]
MGRCLVSLLCLGTLLGLCRGFPGSSCPAPSFQRATNDLSQLWDELDGGERDKRFMKMALSQALLAQASNEVPIGAVIVSEDGTVIGEGHNQVEGLGDATAHAEMLAVREASQRQGGWRLEGSTMYCTVEPCAMCLSAAALARVSRVVYGTRDVRLGAAGSWVDLTQSRHPYHQIEVEGGVLEVQSRQMMQGFFRHRRREAQG